MVLKGHNSLELTSFKKNYIPLDRKFSLLFIDIPYNYLL